MHGHGPRMTNSPILLIWEKKAFRCFPSAWGVKWCNRLSRTNRSLVASCSGDRTHRVQMSVPMFCVGTRSSHAQAVFAAGGHGQKSCSLGAVFFRLHPGGPEHVLEQTAAGAARSCFRIAPANPSKAMEGKPRRALGACVWQLTRIEWL